MLFTIAQVYITQRVTGFYVLQQINFTGKYEILIVNFNNLPFLPNTAMKTFYVRHFSVDFCLYLNP